MKILVTGATGFIGRHLVVALLKRGYSVYCLVRDQKKEEILRKIGAEVLKGDIIDKKSLEKILDYELDAVFHLAGILGTTNIKNDIYWKVNVEGTRNLLTILSKKKLRIIHISSTLVLGDIGKYPANEDKIPHPSDMYERTKYEGEKIANGFCQVGMPVTIIRPEFVYGPHDMHLLAFFKVIRDKRFFFIGNGKNYIQPTYIDDLIDGLLLCLNNNESIGRTYILAGEKPVTIREFISEIAFCFNVPIPKINIPPGFAKLLGLSLEILAKIFQFNNPLPKSRIKFFIQNHFFDISKAKRELGYNPKVNITNGIASTVSWYKENNFL